MMKGRKSMHFTETLPSQNDTIAGHSLYRMFHVLVERLQQRGTGKHWGGWVGGRSLIGHLAVGSLAPSNHLRTVDPPHC